MRFCSLAQCAIRGLIPTLRSRRSVFPLDRTGAGQPTDNGDKTQTPGGKENQSPSLRGDGKGGEQVDRQCRDGRSRAHRRANPRVEGAGQVFRHHPDERRPEHGLKKSVAAPQNGHPRDVGEERHGQVDGEGCAKARGDHAPGGNPVPDEAGNQLARAVGDEAPRHRHAAHVLGDGQVLDDFHQDRCVVYSGKVTCEVNKAAQKGKNCR